MRVVHLTTVHDPFDARIFEKELKTLAVAGFETVLIAPHVRDESVEGISIKAMPPVNGKYQRLLKAGWILIRMALQEKADIYHIHDPELLFWSQFLRIRGYQVVYDMHENVPVAITTKEWLPAVLRKKLLPKLYGALERVLLWHMPVIFAEESYRRYYSWLDAPSAVILNMPIARDLLAVKMPRAELPTIGYIGDVKPLRGSFVTLEALAILNKRGYSVGWECVGQLTDSHQKGMQAFIEQEAIQRVHLYGRTRPADWHPIIAQCHVGLAILAPIPNYQESWPTKLFEYMGLGLPVIASGFPLYRELIDEVGCGLTVDNPTDASELADKIQYLLDNPAEAEAMGERGRQAVEDRFRWNIEAQKLLDFYHHLEHVN